MVPYNPNDPIQQDFLARIRHAESANNYYVGYGGVDIRGYPADAYGFPSWPGAITQHGPTRAAGAYQFQPATWREIAQPMGLDFRVPAHQDVAAWTLAQQRYTAYTGQELYSTLQAGRTAEALEDLSPTWAAFSSGAANVPAPTQPAGHPAAAASAEEAELALTPLPGIVLASGPGPPTRIEYGESVVAATAAVEQQRLGFLGQIWQSLLGGVSNYLFRALAILIGVVLIYISLRAAVATRNNGA